jgi:hypothetical protein
MASKVEVIVSMPKAHDVNWLRAILKLNLFFGNS